MTKLITKDIQQQIIDFTINGVNEFLLQHPNEVFYAFCYDMNLECGEINLCFNTMAYFNETLSYYQQQYPEDYQHEDTIFHLKYNSGDWQYQCFDTLYILEQQITEDLSYCDKEEDIKALLNSLHEAISHCLTVFMTTPTYLRIPKTSDFVAFAIDQEEDIMMLKNIFK